MNQEINKMLSAYALGTHISAIHALKEIIQALTLHTLSKTDFFSHAAFYGGTALRIFHGLDRFSEDMDLPLFQRMTGTQEMYFALPYAGSSALCRASFILANASSNPCQIPIQTLLYPFLHPEPHRNDGPLAVARSPQLLPHER